MSIFGFGRRDQLATGITPTCWHPLHGDVDVSPVFPISSNIAILTLFEWDRIRFHCKCIEPVDHHLEV